MEKWDGTIEDIDKEDWINSGKRIFDNVFEFLDKKFPGYEVLEFEFPIYEDVPDKSLKFKGYVDFIIKHEDKIWILDFKTTKRTWDVETRSDTEKLYQVTLYKKFFCDIFSIDPKKVETAYLLLKRAPYKDEPVIEILETTSGPVKLKNSIEWLKEQAEIIEAGIKVKNTNTCKFCQCGNEKSVLSSTDKGTEGHRHRGTKQMISFLSLPFASLSLCPFLCSFVPGSCFLPPTDMGHNLREFIRSGDL